MDPARDSWETESEMAKKKRKAEWDTLLSLKDEEKSSKRQGEVLIPAVTLAKKLILAKKAQPVPKDQAEERAQELEDL